MTNCLTRIAAGHLAVFVVAALSVPALIADELAVTRVGPPSWWTSPQSQQITLLVEGAGLMGARVTADRDALRIDRVEPGLDGRALFVDVTIAAGAAPGDVALDIESAGGRLRRVFPLVRQPERRPQPIGPDDVIYLIMPDRFVNGDPSNDAPAGEEAMLDRADKEAYHGGDFRGIRQKLPYLADLGVTAIWLNPVYHQGPRWVNSNIGGTALRFAPYHGYMPIDFYNTNPRFGSLAEYRELVAEAHRLGLKVVQDQILGYTGLHHDWVSRPPAENWFYGSLDKYVWQTFRYDRLADPKATDEERRGVLEGWFFGVLPDLATRNPRVRRYALQQSLWWIVLGEADGIRLDTFPMVERDVWRDWDARVKGLFPGYLAVGEAWTHDPGLLSFFQGGRPGWDGIDPGVSSVFDFPLYAAITAVFTGKQPATFLSQVLDADKACPRPDLLVTFFDNHDTPRLTQVGVSPALARVAAAFLLTTRGIPQLTWGDEIGLPAGVDHRREFPGGFPGDARDAFTAAGRSADEQATFDCWRTLLHLRRKHAALRQGDVKHLATGEKSYAYLRSTGGERVLTVLNLDEKAAKLELPLAATGPAGAVERLYGEAAATLDRGTLRIEAPAASAAIFRLAPR